MMSKGPRPETTQHGPMRIRAKKKAYSAKHIHHQTVKERCEADINRVQTELRHNVQQRVPYG